MCIYSHRNGDTVLFHHEGGVEIGDVDAKVLCPTTACLLRMCGMLNQLVREFGSRGIGLESENAK